MSGCVAPISTGPVVFNYAEWSLYYPELAAFVPAARAQLAFNQACLYLNNTAASPLVDNSTGGVRDLILNMLTAHIAARSEAINGNPRVQVVGRIQNAVQGSVSVALDMGATPFTAAWFQQTRYGADAYAALAVSRLGSYTPGRRPYLGVSGAYGRGAW